MSEMNPPIANVMMLSIAGGSEIPQNELQSDMNHGQHREGVAERFVYDVPHVKNLLRTREKQDPLQQGRFFRGSLDRPFELTMPGAKESPQGCGRLSEAQRMTAQAGDAKLTDHVEDHHVDQGDEDGEPLDRVRVGHTQQGA